MTYYPVQQPYEIFNDIDGTPLENGYIYIGVANQNPITNPITVHWDNAGLYPASQPIRTLNGYPARNGSPGKIYNNDQSNRYYSLMVKNKVEEVVFYSRIESAQWNELTNIAVVMNESELLLADSEANIIVLGSDITLTNNYTPTKQIDTNGFEFSGAFTLDFSTRQPKTLTYDCFDSSLTVIGLKTAMPEYFGMKESATSAINSAAFMRCVRACDELKIGPGDFSLDVDTIIFDSDAEAVAHTISGVGINTNLDFSATTTGTCIQVGPLVVSDYTINHGVFYIFENFRIQCGAVDYDDPQIAINFNGVSRSQIKETLIYSSGWGIVCRGFGNVFHHNYIVAKRASFWFPTFAFNNSITGRTEANEGLYGIILGPVIESPFEVDNSMEGNYATDILIDGCIIEGQSSKDTGAGHVGGIGVWAASGVERLTVTNNWFEAISSSIAGGAAGIQLGSDPAGTEYVYTASIQHNAFTGSFTNMSGAIRVIRAIGGKISNNNCTGCTAVFDTAATTYWQGTEVLSNFWAAGVTYDNASFGSVVGGATVPTGGVHRITGNSEATGNLTSTGGDIVSTTGDIQASAGHTIAYNGAAKFGNDITTPRHQAFGHYTGDFTNYTDVNIPSACGGIIMVVLTGAEHSIAIFNNPSGTLALTVVSDAGGILSLVGNAIRITKAGGNAFISLFGRQVEGTTITVVNPV
ncbi:MAG: hypothetical protein KJP07_23280 [Desulfatitalea sp.]|nr:hypothetical protein [Desulfatitalea sp.]